MPHGAKIDPATLFDVLSKAFSQMKAKCDQHPELFGVREDGSLANAKSLLDALYEDGAIPTYSFPKNVISTYIFDPESSYKRLAYQPDRGLDMAISEYAPGRSIVVDKQTYQIGGLYYPGSERRKGRALSPARAFMEDGNYLKNVLVCRDCNWFGLEEDSVQICPFCGSKNLERDRQMLRPWGFAPRNATSIQNAQLTEEYSYAQPPFYSTLPDGDEMHPVNHCAHIRLASRANQRIIMMNRGPSDQGFAVCADCGAAMPGRDRSVFRVKGKEVGRPYRSAYAQAPCGHINTVNVNLGYDFITDMLVLEFALDPRRIDTRRKDNPWLERAAQSLAEALRLAASKELDIEFSELVTGYRLRANTSGFFADIYLYDNLSSGAGYAVRVAREIGKLLRKTELLLNDCDCQSSCHNCLKHYRNQFVHGMLDRFAALDLLKWGIDGSLANELSPEAQKSYLSPLRRILEDSGCRVWQDAEGVILSHGLQKKRLVVYPAMWAEPANAGKIYISNGCLKYAKPYAVQKIMDSF